MIVAKGYLLNHSSGGLSIMRSCWIRDSSVDESLSSNSRVKIADLPHHSANVCGQAIKYVRTSRNHEQHATRNYLFQWVDRCGDYMPLWTNLLLSRIAAQDCNYMHKLDRSSHSRSISGIHTNIRESPEISEVLAAFRPLTGCSSAEITVIRLRARKSNILLRGAVPWKPIFALKSL